MLMPGSKEAQNEGCTCPAPNEKDGFVFLKDCSVHSTLAAEDEKEREADEEDPEVS